jgi:hypothetical protein
MDSGGQALQDPASVMSASRTIRPSDSSLVSHITRVRYTAPTDELSTPDGCWDIVVIRRGDTLVVLQTGLISRPVPLQYGAGDEYLAISFKPGVFMPRLPGPQTVDKGLVRPIAASRQAFHMEGEIFEIPTFENVECLVDRLVRRSLITRDDLVAGVVDGRPLATTPRSLQRHFLRALGMTPKQLAQIQRAGRAVELLQAGRPAAAVAAEVGFADQPHMVRSLKAIMGQTPGQLARARGGRP